MTAILFNDSEAVALTSPNYTELSNFLTRLRLLLSPTTRSVPCWSRIVFAGAGLSGACDQLRRVRRDRHAEPEQGSASNFAFCTDGPAHRLDKFFRDDQATSAYLLAEFLAEAVERSKQARQFFRCQSMPCIAHANTHLSLSIHGARYIDVSPRRLNLIAFDRCLGRHDDADNIAEHRQIVGGLKKLHLPKQRDCNPENGPHWSHKCCQIL